MVWLVTVIIGWVAEKFGNKIAILVFRMAVLTAFVIILESAITGFFTLMDAHLDSVHSSVPDLVSMVWGWVMPNNARQCEVVIISAHISKFFFVLTYRYFNMRARTIMTSVS